MTGVAQIQATAQKLNLGMGLSQYGRVSTPFPLWDGTDRVLVAFTPCEVSRAGVVVSCATLTAAEKARLGEERLAEDIQRRRAAGQRAPVVRDLHVRPERSRPS